MSKPKMYDFSGWATRHGIKCSDGRTICKDAFRDDDGKCVPLVWMHQHQDPLNVLGHAVLESRDGDMYAYCSFNDTSSGKQVREMVRHGDVVSLSIWANNLTQNGGDVLHGSIKEVSVVLAGANPGALIDYPVLAHGEENQTMATICMFEPIDIFHSEDDEEQADESQETEGTGSEEPVEEEEEAEESSEENLAHSEDEKGSGERTVKDILDTMNEEQLQACKWLVDEALKEGGLADEDEKKPSSDNIEHSEKESEELTMNVFEQYGGNKKPDHAVLSHADGMDMIQFAKENHISLKQVIKGWAEDNNLNPNELSHSDLGINDVDQVFPDYKLVNGPAPEKMTTDQGWISKVIAKVHKSPMSRLRVRFADVRDISARRAKGYKKGTQKDLAGNIDLLGRTVDPTTVYISSKLDRDDIVDITDFDYVNYMYQLDKMNLNEEIARQIMIGDGRSGDKAIDATKIKPIWTDDDLFCIHTKVDVAAMRTTMNGTNSSANFGDNYVYAEAVIQSLLYAREQYKGSGNPDFYCTPHLVNIMLLARDLNGRRIYDNVSELTAALNVNSIITAEQFEGKTRIHDAGKVTQETRELLGIMVNLGDYTVGATKGGEITHFTDFDIRFNQELSLIETRFSGMLTRPYSAIALEVAANPQ